jgi:stage II sporulation protein AA (anti-sigma F factor antagonist)
VNIANELNRRVHPMTDEYFQIVQEGDAHVITLRLPQSMDSNEFDRINEQVLEIFAEHTHPRWVLDLTGINYMGSSVLGLLVNIRQRVMTLHGQLVLCGLSPQLLRVFRTCCMEKLFKISKTRGDALKWIAK